MTSFMNTLRDAARKRAAYRRTVRDLSNMPLETAIDLDIYPPHASRIAHEAVYGR